jgi:hypothetical protein
MEKFGVAAVHIEDQFGFIYNNFKAEKRCGHRPSKVIFFNIRLLYQLKKWLIELLLQLMQKQTKILL